MEARLGVAPPISTAATEVKPIIIGTIVQLDEAEGLCIYQDTYCSQDGRKNGTHQTHPVYIDACGLGKHGIRIAAPHGNSSLRTHKEPHQKAL